MTMKLTKKQQDMLDGKLGEAKQFCMSKLVDFGEAVEATEMVDLSLVLCACPIFSKNPREPETTEKLNAYDLGHSRLYDPIFAMKDAHVADETGTTCGNDPYFVQFDKVNEKGYPWNFEIPGKGSFQIDNEMYTDLKAGYDKLLEHGHLPWLSCNPYLNTRIPKMGEFCSSSESSAACYINTILGARSNRESPVNTVYSAYTGCGPKYGTHLDENRAAKCIVTLDDEVRENVKGMADWGALGAVIAAKAGNRIMAVENLPITTMSAGATKNLISCASPGMNDPILHLIGTTPESPTVAHAFKGDMPRNPERYTVTMDDLVEMFLHLNSLAPAPGPDRAKPVDIVIVGCPHATFDEVREVARLVKGRKVKEGVQLWVQTDTPTYFMAQHYGDTKTIEDAGGKIYHQTCMAMTPFRHYPKNLTIATSSFKYVKLGAGFGAEGTTWIYGNPEAIVDAAVTGVFTPTARWDYWSAPKEARLASERVKPLYEVPVPMIG